MPAFAGTIHHFGGPTRVADLASTEVLYLLARTAAQSMCERTPVTVTIAAPYDRPKGWPLPMKREANGQPMNYRPLAILDYVEYALAERDRARLAPADCSDLV